MDAGTPLPLLNAEVNDLRFAGACTGAPRRSPRSRTNGSGVLRAGTEEFSAPCAVSQCYKRQVGFTCDVTRSATGVALLFYANMSIRNDCACGFRDFGISFCACAFAFAHHASDLLEEAASHSLAPNRKVLLSAAGINRTTRCANRSLFFGQLHTAFLVSHTLLSRLCTQNEAKHPSCDVGCPGACMRHICRGL